LIFQTTVRSLSCSEIADDSIVVARLKKLYDTLDSGTTPATVLMPWFPTPSMIKKLLATKQIYDIVARAINAREQSGISRNDTLQFLLDMGDEKLAIVGVRSMISFHSIISLTVLIVYHGSVDRRGSGNGNHRYEWQILSFIPPRVTDSMV